MNARAKLDRVPEDRVAADFLAEKPQDRGQRADRRPIVGRLGSDRAPVSTSRWWRSRCMGGYCRVDPAGA